jgi:hypothetical protein
MRETKTDRLPLAMLVTWAEKNPEEIQRHKHRIHVRDAALWTMTVIGLWAMMVAFSC